MFFSGLRDALTATVLAVLCLAAASCQSFSAAKSGDVALTEWIGSNAVPLVSVEPGSRGDDIVAFGEMIGDARLVALGEPTHGNREVFQLKHRMFEYLVQEKGFRIFAIEAPFAESEDLNAYVLRGHGSAEEALASLTMWAWDTEEVAALLDWMRAYNADPENIEKLQVYGFDPQSPERAARLTLNYLRRVDAPFAALVGDQIAGLAVPYSDPDELGWRPIRQEEASDAAKAAAGQILARFEEKEADYVAASSEAEWSRHRQYAQMVNLWIGMYHNDGALFGELREQGMLSNVQWMMDKNGPESKAVLWAHNTHVADVQAARWGDVEFAGRLWRRVFGDDLRIVGFRFNHGEFTALSARARGELETF